MQEMEILTRGCYPQERKSKETFYLIKLDLTGMYAKQKFWFPLLLDTTIRCLAILYNLPISQSFPSYPGSHAQL